MKKRKVILVTDGDHHVQRALESLAKQLGGRCISQSQGNPSRLTGKQLVDLILQTPYDPVFVMFDDSGIIGEGAGEQALRYVATHEQIDVLGAIAVASNTNNQEWTKVNICIDYDGNFTTYGVDKEGIREWEFGRINGDTVYCLDDLPIPIIVGIGDIGKMRRRDDIRNGCPITRKAIEYILERSERDENRKSHTDFFEVE